MKDAAKTYNIPYTLVSKTAWIESNFNHLAKSRRGTASGLFQIIKSTEVWLRTICKNVPKGDIFNPKTNSFLGACYLKYNSTYLQRRLKRKPANYEVYLAHFFGSSKAVKFLRTNKNRLGKNVFPREARYNRAIFYKGRKARTIGQIKQYFINKVKKAKLL